LLGPKEAVGAEVGTGACAVAIDAPSAAREVAIPVVKMVLTKLIFLDCVMKSASQKNPLLILGESRGSALPVAARDQIHSAVAQTDRLE
jgi:hypothetical protein